LVAVCLTLPPGFAFCDIKLTVRNGYAMPSACPY